MHVTAMPPTPSVDVCELLELCRCLLASRFVESELVGSFPSSPAAVAAWSSLYSSLQPPPCTRRLHHCLCLAVLVPLALAVDQMVAGVGCPVPPKFQPVDVVVATAPTPAIASPTPFALPCTRPRSCASARAAPLLPLAAVFCCCTTDAAVLSIATAPLPLALACRCLCCYQLLLLRR